MLSFPLSEEYIINILHQVHPHINYIDIEAIEYIIAFVTPWYKKIIKLNDVESIKQLIDIQTRISKEKSSLLAKESIIFATKEYDSCQEEDKKIEQFIYGFIYYLLADILTVAGDELLEFNNILYPKDNIDIPINSDDLFMGIFNDNELRFMFFGIMPSPITDEIIIGDEILNVRCMRVVKMFINYLFTLYGRETYEELVDMIKTNYPVNNPILFTLTENIKLNSWNIDSPRFYIISIYDNNIIDWKTPLLHIL